MSGRPGDHTTEMHGGSTVAYLARHTSRPLVSACFNGWRAAFLLTVGSFLLTMELFLLTIDNFSFFTYSWSFLAYKFSFYLQLELFLFKLGKCIQYLKGL